MTKELLPPREMVDYSADETNRYVKDILAKSPNIHGLFIETDQPVEGALQALKAAKKTNDVLIVSFDAMPDVADLLKSGTLVAVGMQQPYLMGNKAAEALIGSLHGQPQPKQLLVPILVANNKNIVQLLPVANKTVFGRDTK
jgi:ABC-type sugar transport system substrate-binding protein